MVDPIFGPDSVVSQNNTTGVGRPTPGHHKRSNPAGIFIFTMNGNVGRVALSVYRLATGWTVRGSNPGEDEIFRTCPDRPWGPPSLLYHAYRVFPGGKERPGCDADPSPPSSAMVMKEYSYTSTPPMGCMACTEPQYLYKGALYLLHLFRALRY